MSKPRPRVLFVDDEPSIRLTLGMYLEDQGFAVITAATVAEALSLISQQNFDVLLADLNVGQAGDGFTVVSAMRRTQPRAVTFILTGYPAFQSALEAIRLQVDDYITKPTDTETLAQKIRAKLAEPRREHYVQTRRLVEILGQNVPAITELWLDGVRLDPRLGKIKISDEARTDHVPRVLQAAIGTAKGEKISELDTNAARDHGLVRRRQGYTVPLLIRETWILLDILAKCMQENLLAIDISYLIPDLLTVNQTIVKLLEQSAAAFLEGPPKK